MAAIDIRNIRNVVLAGHSATGKTTLGDLVLFKTGKATRPGSVDDGTSLLDTDEEEKQRKGTVTASICYFDHKGKRFHLIDTPGATDFVGQAGGSFRAAETAVLTISAPAGIEVNTRRTFAMATEAGLARVLVVNKCDADNTDCAALVQEIRQLFGNACIPLNVPVGQASSFSGVVSTLKQPDEVPGDAVIDPKELHQQLMDAIVEADDALMERFLEGEDLAPEEVAGGITKALAAGTLIPIFFCSAKKDIGVSELLDALAEYAPAPTDIQRVGLKDGEEVEIQQSADAPLVAQVFKNRIDPFVAKMSFVRIFGGTLKKDQSVTNHRDGSTVKVGQLNRVQGAQLEPIDSATAGEIVAVVKIESLKIGDTIGDPDAPVMPPIVFPKPMVAMAVEPKSRADQAKISGALQKIEEEDPTFHIVRDPQTKELVIWGMSEQHLQTMIDRLQKRDKVEVVTRPPKIPYRETITGTAEGSYRHKKQTGGAGQFGEVHFKLSPMPQGVNPEEFFTKERFLNMREYHYDPELNFAFVDRITGGAISNNFIPAVEKGVRERMEQGVIAGYQVQDVICELFFGKEHPVDSNETAFKTAASMCFREVFQKANPVLLEPIVKIDITVPGDRVGDVTSDLNTRRGRMEGMESAPGGFQVIHAKMPLAEMLNYARALSSLTGGQGFFTFEFSHYEMMPPNEQAKVIAEAQRQKEEQG